MTAGSSKTNNTALVISLTSISLTVVGLLALNYGTITTRLADVCARLDQPAAAKWLYLQSASHSRGRAAIDPLVQVARNEEQAGHRREAVGFYEQALTIARADRTEKSVVAGLLSRIGKLRMELNDKSADRYLLEAIGLRQQPDGSDDKHSYYDLQRMAMIEESNGRYNQAIDFLRRRTAIAQTLGWSPDLTAEDELQMARCYAAMGDLDSALERAQSALEATVDHFGEKHPRAITARIKLGRVKQLRGDHKSAIDAVKNAEIWPPTVDGDVALINIGNSFFENNNLEDAKRTFELCVKLSRYHRERKLEAVGLADLAAVTAKRGDLAEAKSLAAKSLKIYREEYGDDSAEANRALASFRQVSNLMDKAN